MDDITIHEDAVSAYISGAAPYLNPEAATAYAIGYNFGYIQAMLDTIERQLDRLNEVAATPEQVAFEERCAAREEQWKNEVTA